VTTLVLTARPSATGDVVLATITPQTPAEHVLARSLLQPFGAPVEPWGGAEPSHAWVEARMGARGGPERLLALLEVALRYGWLIDARGPAVHVLERLAGLVPS
jgi:hypothetical protein